MAFDAERYDREVIKPLRGRYGRLPAGDLAARYAVDPDWTAGELAVHLVAIRQFWQEHAAGPDSRAEICRLLIRADEELRRTAGALMADPAWWREQAGVTGGATAARATADHGTAGRNRWATAPPPPGPSTPTAGSGPASWRAEARAFLLARLDGPAPPMRAAGRPAPPSPAGRRDGHSPSPVTPAATSRPLPELAVAVLGVEGNRCRVRVTWSGASHDQVRVRWSTEPPPWPAGTRLPSAALDGFGSELTGRREEHRERPALVALMPVGYHLYVPFLVDGPDRVTVGRFVALGLAEPVRGLRAERRGDVVVVSWTWPEGARLVLVEWDTPAGPERREVTRSGYARSDGFRLSPPEDATVVRVTAITVVGADEARSPVRDVSLPSRPIPVSYTVNRNWRWRFGRRELTVRVRAAGDLAGADVVVVLGHDISIPMSPERGTMLGRWVGLDLHPDEDLDLAVDVPPLPRSPQPYWIRCFVDAPGHPTVIDPPVESMKVA